MRAVSACVRRCEVYICICVCVHSETRGQPKKLVFRECPSFIRDRIFCGPEASSTWLGWMTIDLPVFTSNLFVDGMTGECHHKWVFSFVCMSIYVWVHVCACMWGSEVDVK